MLLVQIFPNPYCPIALFVEQGYYFQGELAERWADGWLDWRSCLCRN